MQGKKRGARLFGSLFLLGAVLLLSLAACGTGGGSNGGSGNGGSSNSGSGNIATPTSQAGAEATESPTGTALTVLGVDMAVSPKSLSSYACGSNLTVAYTATFHFPSGNAGGPVAFAYTTNNGRSQTSASLTVQSGQTSVAYQFTWSGTLPDDHTMPAPGGVMVTSPDQLTSQLVGPTGACSTATAQFAVLSVSVTASPSVDGHACGTSFTEKYTATFTIASNSPGGTIVFAYTTNNGHSNSQNISLHVSAGQTTKTYTFTWSGVLPADHTAPGIGLVQVTSPNQVISSPGVPSGQCS